MSERAEFGKSIDAFSADFPSLRLFTWFWFGYFYVYYPGIQPMLDAGGV